MFRKVIIKYNGAIPCYFLLKCQSMKEFKGGTGQATFKTMKKSITLYMSEKAMKKMLICIVAGGEAVNSGKHHGVVNIMKELVGWDIYYIHYTNHQLELSIKKSFKKESVFNILKRFFNCNLAAPLPNFDCCQGGSNTNPMLITAFETFLARRSQRAL